MSRLGKLPVAIPQGVQVAVQGGTVSVQGPKGKLDLKLGVGIEVTKKDNALVVARKGDDTQSRANHGTTRAKLAGMMLGVTQGWKKTLILTGVGYGASLKGQSLLLTVGLSHEAKIELPKEIKCKADKTTIELESANAELLGNIAAKIRKLRPPEPYLGKGIKLSDEVIRRKAGKAGKK